MLLNGATTCSHGKGWKDTCDECALFLLRDSLRWHERMVTQKRAEIAEIDSRWRDNAAHRRGEMSQWQPMETAPRDGTRILLYRPLAFKTDDEQIVIMRGIPHDKGCWRETVPVGMDATNYTDGCCKATHWMPLPDPPVS